MAVVARVVATSSCRRCRSDGGCIGLIGGGRITSVVSVLVRALWTGAINSRLRVTYAAWRINTLQVGTGPMTAARIT